LKLKVKIMFKLSEVNKYSNQHIFDRVVEYAATMTSKSESENYEPRYKMFDDSGNVVNACFIGHFIDDDKYKPEMEGLLFSSVKDDSAIKPFKFQDIYSIQQVEPTFKTTKRREELLNDLQGIHDFKDMDEWESEFIKVAKKHCLNRLTINKFQLYAD